MTTGRTSPESLLCRSMEEALSCVSPEKFKVSRIQHKKKKKEKFFHFYSIDKLHFTFKRRNVLQKQRVVDAVIRQKSQLSQCMKSQVHTEQNEQQVQLSGIEEAERLYWSLYTPS